MSFFFLYLLICVLRTSGGFLCFGEFKSTKKASVEKITKSKRAQSQGNRKAATHLHGPFSFFFFFFFYSLQRPSPLGLCCVLVLVVVVLPAIGY
jgi:hypothetical protein